MDICRLSLRLWLLRYKTKWGGWLIIHLLLCGVATMRTKSAIVNVCGQATVWSCDIFQGSAQRNTMYLIDYSVLYDDTVHATLVQTVWLVTCDAIVSRLRFGFVGSISSILAFQSIKWCVGWWSWQRAVHPAMGWFKWPEIWRCPSVCVNTLFGLKPGNMTRMVLRVSHLLQIACI